MMVQKKRRKSSEVLEEKMEGIAKGLSKALGVSVKVKKPSKNLEAALNALALDFRKLQQKVDYVFTVGRKEGYNDKEIGKMIREKMEGQYHKNTITKVFEKYPDAKKAPSGRPFGTKSVPTDENESDDSNDETEVTSEADKFRFYKETIAAKNKLLKEKDEEIAGLRVEISKKDKRIIELEKELKK